MKKFDFSGYATKHNLKCSDGRIIMKDAFKHNDGATVPLVWQHLHNEPYNILGHAVLENKQDGVYAYGKFNDTEAGLNAKELVAHGDITALSIYANGLKQKGSSVMHGEIREVSLVLSGANPGAFIDNLNFAHSDEVNETEAIIFTGLELSHSDIGNDDEEELEVETEEPVKHADTKTDDELTVQDVFDSMTEQQKNVVYAMLGQALEESGNAEVEHSYKEGESDMKFNIFDKESEVNDQNNVLTHSDMETIISNAKRHGSLKESVIAHGIEQIDYLFPDARNITDTPISIYRDMSWVSKVMSATHKTPFSRIKSILADLTEDEARARGYIKGNKKKEEVFSLLKRTTTPQTIYKKQKLDRDDIVDITDFDVVAWLKSEMRVMLDEELARAFLVGDGRLASSDDKISEEHIRPVWKDDDLYAIKAVVDVDASTTPDKKAREFIKTAIRARKDYKGSGEPTLYITEDILTECLLIEDLNQRIVYDTIVKLATAMRVKEIISVPVMEGLTRTDTDNKTRSLMGIIVNLNDYNVGADKGGAINMFEDFDIDYNAQKYLIETRCSGALIKPYSAIVLETVV